MLLGIEVFGTSIEVSLHSLSIVLAGDSHITMHYGGHMSKLQVILPLLMRARHAAGTRPIRCRHCCLGAGRLGLKSSRFQR